ncbi:type II CRISPR RNA-guided endonuclease Cas9 [Flavobacterium sp.]|uniref:type II CRISPR RNA-guided endonuclease Cas9 n=1 Tax=Flavobacterium sp. TaxID=239 RepID=UPI0022BDDF1C|nr:type II CRISPR RNA-guided endonuclease Cas9 [Flavobacterium sp.]MCZ8228832.1 type II CRISPR RNA-guided endonuclease Cas9 [Flavobacterium sp.]
MAKILGLDLGTNSIGWALINEQTNKILGIGSRIFPMGVENLGEGEGREMSKNAGRTGARGVRRQFFRRRLRKKILLKALSENKMCPMIANDFEDWKKTKEFPSDKLANWFALNPYELRQKALNEKLTLEEMGRIFYHLIQRRGFLSNSRKGGTDDGAIFKGNPKEGKIGITETQDKIQEKTLGSYLFEIYPKENQPFQEGLERIRNRYTTRKMYVDEFELIWDKQAEFHGELTEELKTIFGGRKLDGYKEDGILFHQRPLRSQKHLVGNCSFEPSKTKCPISAIPFEQFRIWQWVNTVEYNGNKISQEEKLKIVEFLYANEKPEFKKIRKAIGKETAEFKFNYKDDDKIVGTYTIANLSNKKYFGKKWFEFTEKEQEDIWHVLYFFDSKSNLKDYAIKNWNFSEEQAIAISKFNVKDGYSSLSRKAIANILPFLQIGFTYDVAVVLGGIKNVFGNNWYNLSEEKRDFLIDNTEGIVRSKTKGGFIDIIKDILRNDYGISDHQMRKLYHHSATIDVAALIDKLPVGKEADKEIQKIKNPIVITALFELRKLVNELLDEHGKIDEIKVEMARDLKVSKSQRNQIRRDQKRLEKENDRVKTEVLKYTNLSHDTILKFKLWEECKKTCPYTGMPIPLNELFTNKWQIEHIHPWSKSLNDSFSNKTLCLGTENIKKGNKTPFEYYGNDEANWSTIKERALKLFSFTKEYPDSYNKFKRFVKQSFDDDFTSRQLNDTRYISKEAKNYLSKICKNVMVSPGQATSNLRQKWGLNHILNDENAKTREDHRHHAIDALVMACTKLSYVQELSKWNRYNRMYDLKQFPLPWKTFNFDAEKAVERILISHKKVSNDITIRYKTIEKNGEKHTNKGVAARGQLHKEFVYGKRKAPNSDEAYHIRKPIESLLTEKHIGKVVDISIRNLIFKRVNELGGFDKDKIPDNTFFKVDLNGVKHPQIFLPNKNGKPVPVLKVRIQETINKAKQLKTNSNQFVNPRNNDHVLIYETIDGQLEKDVVSFWEVVERKKQGLNKIQLPFNGKRVIETFKENDMFILFKNEDEINWNSTVDLSDNLYKVQKIAGADYFMEICFRKHNDSRDDKNAKGDYVYIKGFGEGKTGWFTFNPIKVKISVSGKIQKL